MPGDWTPDDCSQNDNDETNTIPSHHYNTFIWKWRLPQMGRYPPLPIWQIMMTILNSLHSIFLMSLWMQQVLPHLPLQKLSCSVTSTMNPHPKENNCTNKVVACDNCAIPHQKTPCNQTNVKLQGICANKLLSIHPDFSPLYENMPGDAMMIGIIKSVPYKDNNNFKTQWQFNNLLFQVNNAHLHDTIYKTASTFNQLKATCTRASKSSIPCQISQHFVSSERDRDTREQKTKKKK